MRGRGLDWGRPGLRGLDLRSVAVRGLASFALVALAGCTCNEKASSEDAAGTAPLPASQLQELPPPDGQAANPPISLIDRKALCTLREQGLVLDLGDDGSEALRSFRFLPDSEEHFVGRVGESFRNLDQQNNDFVFWLPQELSQFAVQVFVHGTDSDRMAVYVDDRRLGAGRLQTGETRAVELAGHGELKKGRHKLRLSLSKAKGTPPGADVAWVRIGKPGWRKQDLPATMRQVFSEVTIEEVGHRSIIVKPGGEVRCPLWIPKSARLVTQMGLWGSGAGDGEVAIIEMDGRRTVLGGQQREQEDFRSFAELSFDLAAFAGRFVEVQFIAHPKGDPARVAFADPVIVTPARSRRQPPLARRAIVVILGGLAKDHVPPLAAENGLPFLNQFENVAVSYPHYRSTTTSVPGLIASLLTATPPAVHGVSRASHKLTSRVRTLGAAVEAAGGRSAFFTGVPYSFPPLGFERGFERFVEVYPQHDEAAEKPLLNAESWLQSALKHDGPVLVLVHLRGAHPPFDVTQDDARRLPPHEYGGELNPRRAAIQLGEIRARRLERHRRMPSEDWVRLHALQKAALLKQSAALQALVTQLQKADAFDDTMLIVMGDVSAGEPPHIPYDPDAPLEEEYLGAPLFIKYAGGYGMGNITEGYFSPRDISHTIAENLGVSFIRGRDPIDLALPEAEQLGRLRPHIAYRDQHYSLRMGSYLLTGEDGRSPGLCLLEVDPSCAVDRTSELSTLTHALWMTAWSDLRPSLQAAIPPEEQEDDETEDFENALLVWGVAH